MSFGLKIGDETYSVETGCQFEIIDQGDQGRGVRYMGRYTHKNDDELLLVPLKQHQPICFFDGTIILYQDADKSEDAVLPGVIRNKEMFQEALDSWKRNYLVEYDNGVILVPNAETVQDINNPAYLINTDKFKKCNCVISKARNTYAICWKVAKGKTIKPGEILTGFYSDGASEMYTTKSKKKKNQKISR